MNCATAQGTTSGIISKNINCIAEKEIITGISDNENTANCVTDDISGILVMLSDQITVKENNAKNAVISIAIR